MDPDPEGPETCGSGRSGFGRSGFGTVTNGSFFRHYRCKRRFLGIFCVKEWEKYLHKIKNCGATSSPEPDHRCEVKAERRTSVTCSVASRGPRSGAFFDPWIRDPGSAKNQDPDMG
jgi:hypothetical protein